MKDNKINKIGTIIWKNSGWMFFVLIFLLIISIIDYKNRVYDLNSLSPKKNDLIALKKRHESDSLKIIDLKQQIAKEKSIKGVIDEGVLEGVCEVYCEDTVLENISSKINQLTDW